MKFCAGDFSLDHAPWLGRPVEVDSDHIETLIENNQYSTMQEIADILKICKSIKLLVKMKNVSFMEKTIRSFWPTQCFVYQVQACLPENIHFTFTSSAKA